MMIMIIMMMTIMMLMKFMIMVIMIAMMMMMMMMMMINRLTFVKTRYPILYVHRIKKLECSEPYRYINVCSEPYASELDTSVIQII